MRIIGIDIGKVSFKAVRLEKSGGGFKIADSYFSPHRQKIQKHYRVIKDRWDISESDSVMTTGRFRKTLPFPCVVEKPAQERAARFLYPGKEITVIRLGGGGFSVLNLNSSGLSDYSRNPRCAAGVGSFLDQIMKRVNCDIVSADKLAARAKGIDITKRCGVTMKTDFTHLLNSGHDIEEVIAGLLDASAKSAVELAQKKGVNSLVLVIGGLSRLKRIQKTIRESFQEEAQVCVPENSLYFESLGAALEAAEGEKSVPSPKKKSAPPAKLQYLPPLSRGLRKVRKFSSEKEVQAQPTPGLIAGLDIGSTGSKLVVFDGKPVFEAYTETAGRPVEAARELLKKVPGKLYNSISAVGITGSGRDIVSGALKASLPQGQRKKIFVLNEIAAHAAGAHFYDSRVDTVVDIGGQDAKYTRLDSGRVIDSCMNTVCSAGTGSFLAEQLAELGIDSVEEFGKIALRAKRAVDLGQHCAVFISEQIDEAKRAGAGAEEIVAGLYYSVVLNYDNRVKGTREYGERIFLQGKPATNLALAAALAEVTGKRITVPPSPGTPGALGIAVLTGRELEEKISPDKPLSLDLFLQSTVIERKSFRCKSSDGCLEGNLCPVQRIKLKTGKKEKTFFWGGACDKFEDNKNKNGSIARAPDPFAEREKMIQKLARRSENGGKTVGIPRGLETEEILPFAISFFSHLGMKVKLTENKDTSLIEKGAGLCESTFCAPLQILGGQAKVLEEEDFLFLPKVIEVSRSTKEDVKGRCYACPLSQAAPDMFAPKLKSALLTPQLNLKKGFRENLKEFISLKSPLNRSGADIRAAFKKALDAQEKFSDECLNAGRKALKFAGENNLPAVVLLGHPYIVNSPLISSGIPEGLRQSGAVALPASCYPAEGANSDFRRVFWGYGRNLLEAAADIRETDGVYPLWLSVYSCGPDSFLIHFFQYISRGKPYAILESDAYTGQAGFKTRIEAFIYGINNYEKPDKDTAASFRRLCGTTTVAEAMENGGKILMPRMGETSVTASAMFNSIGAETIALPADSKEHLELGRKYTSGKECLPMIITLGSLLKFLRENDGHYHYMMPRADGPCRFGKYHLLIKIALEKAGMSERVKIISPTSVTGYSQHIKGAAMAKAWASTVLTDLLRDALLDLRPEEKVEGSAQELFDSYMGELKETLNNNGKGWSGIKNLWGLEETAKKAAADFKNLTTDESKKGKPTVLVTGEIFLRLNSFSNNNVLKELESLNVKTKLAPFREWINYVNWLRRKGLAQQKPNPFKIRLSTALQRHIEKRLYGIFARALNWPEDHPMENILEEAEDYLKDLKPLGEAALTIGLPLLLWKKKEIDAAVIVGPFECMPSRIGETQLNLISKKHGLPVLNLSYYGEPPDRDILEGFTHFLN